MNILNLTIKAYSCLLRLYPGSFRREFEEQMLLDFSDMAADSRQKGKLAFLLFCLHELVDFPRNVVRAHLKEGGMIRMLRSQPVNYGMRGAMGFGMTFFMIAILDNFVYWKIDASKAAITKFLLNVFHTAQGLQFVPLFSFFVSVLITGLLFGIMVALLFGDRSRSFRYILVAMLGWFLSYAGTAVCVATSNIHVYLDAIRASYLTKIMAILSILFLGLLWAAARTDKQGLYRASIVGSFVYPLLLYSYIELFFASGMIEFPVMFTALIALAIIYVASVLLIALKSRNTPTTPWIFFVLGFGCFLLPYLSNFIYWQLFPTAAVFFTEPPAWQQTFVMAVRNGIFEVPLGILVGIALAIQKKNGPRKPLLSA